MGFADVMGTPFHDHARTAGGATPARPGCHDPGAVNAVAALEHDEELGHSCEHFWIDLGGEG